MKLDGVIDIPHKREGVCAVMLEDSHLVFAGQGMLKHTVRLIEGKHKYSRKQNKLCVKNKRKNNTFKKLQLV